MRYISSTLDELPETLDETYERILQGIPKKMRNDAHHIFQWIMVSSRPLRVEEVAEVFAINFDEEMSGIPKFEPSWRDPNPETAVLSACSTLVAIIDNRSDGKVVQFSHFSVKEYLTSDRITNAEHISDFHIHPKPAHILLAKACLSVLSQLDYSMDQAEIQTFRMAEYAARHWAEHARFEDVSSYIGDGVDLLFDKDKPHFAIWVWVYDMDGYYSYRPTTHPKEPDAVPLYYAALCGFRGLVERLLIAHPQDLNAEGGSWGAPLNAALGEGHLDIVLFLLDRGADGENTGRRNQTGVYIASSRGYADVVRSLVDRGADLNTICQDRDRIGRRCQWTPLHVASWNGIIQILTILLEHGADPNALDDSGQTALHLASSREGFTDVELLLEYGADMGVQDEDGWTPLHGAAHHLNLQVVAVLLNRGADPHTQTYNDDTPIRMAYAPHPRVSKEGRAQIMRLLSERTSKSMLSLRSCD